MLTYEVSVAMGGMIHWIQSVFVVQEARRIGVFRSLYNHVIAQAKLDQFVKCVRLYCETENFKA
jgi:GNAT superfamily N-acetyltransferase